jgi:hypothetical protein
MTTALTNTITLWSDETDPDRLLAWPNLDGTLRDLTPPWTLTAEYIDTDTNELVDTKTTGITGADGTGASNVNLSWTTAELTALQGRKYWLRVTATNGTETAVFTINQHGGLPLLRIIPRPVT